MTWKKIDDYCGSTYVAEQPYSAFVAQGLTNNAKSYPLELAQGSARAFPTGTTPIKWASYGESTGTVIWVNAGLNARSVTFKITYSTATNNQRNDRAGVWTVRHVASLVGQVFDAPASTAGTSLTVTINLPLGSNEGYQAFWFGFQSEILEDLGTVEGEYIANNTIGLHETGTGAGHYPITSGEKFEFLIFDHATAPLQISQLNLLGLQLGYLEALNSQAGVGVVFPATPVFPAGTGVNDIQKGAYLANVYELGTVLPTSVSYYVSDADESTLVDQFNHYDAIALTGLNSAQSEALVACRPELANGAVSPYRLGRLLFVAPLDALTTTFCVQADTEGSIQAILSVVAVNEVFINQSANVTFSINVLDSTGASILPLGADITQEVILQRYSPPADFYQDAYTFRALIGVYAGNEAWGLRDGIPFPDVRKGSTVLLQTPPLSFDDVAAGGVYTIRITVNYPVYVFAYSARLV